MNGFEKRAERIKEKILKTTLELLWSSDPKRLRIADIAKAARVSQVTIYNYFGSKEELLREILRNYTDKATSGFEAFMNEGHPLKETIEHIFVMEKEHYKQFPPRLIRELLQEDHEMARYIEEQYREKSIPITVRLFQEAKDRGEIPEHVSIEHILALLQIYMNQFETILEMAQQSADMDKFLDSMVQFFFYGICGKP